MIPDYQTLMRPVLASAAQGERKISDVVSEIIVEFSLTPEEQAELLPSGKQTVIANRVHWAKAYLKQAGLIEATKRGVFNLTPRGRDVLADATITLDAKFLRNFEEFRDFQSRASKAEDAPPPTKIEEDSLSTPDEDLFAAHAKLQKALGASLLDQVRSLSPAFFEQIIVDLLIGMGYGGSSKDAGKALGQSGDNGVDGVIDQDPLGVDQIYLQAKRYAQGNPVGAGEIRDFFGALSLKKASKGIFVTTSNFTSSATQTARDLGARIVLIDGDQLVNLMIRYNIGCRDKTVLHIKALDETYFEEG